MLQIPSSVVGVFSSSYGLFGGLCLGAQVMIGLVFSGPSVPKYSFHATQTTEIVFMPTKCVPSSDITPFPHVAAMGYAAIVSTSLFCILRAKGFSYSSDSRTHTTPSPSRNGVGPPSPSPDPGSTNSTDKSPRRSPWMWLLLLVFLLVLAGGIAAYIFCTIHTATRVSHAVSAGASSLCSKYLSWIEGYLAAGWACILAVQAHICLNHWQYSKILLLALASHFVGILSASVLARLRTYAKLLSDIWWLDFFSSHLVCIAVIASSSWLSWMLWMIYYFGCWDGALLTCHSLRLLYNPPTQTHHYFWTVIGIGVVHASILCLWTTFLVLYGFPSTTQMIVRRLPCLHHPWDFISHCLFTIAFFFAEVLVAFPLLQYPHLHPDAKRVLRDPLSSQESRDMARGIFWFLLRRYQDWKSEQVEDFQELTAGLLNTLMATFRSCLEIWSVMGMPQKFLIAAPAIIFYGYYFDIAVAFGPQEAPPMANFLSSPPLSHPVEDQLAARRRPVEAANTTTQEDPR
ncbi:hypothetical protein DFH07DRAFT_1013792 [Mycena maculata]|uniref:Uncharacterized protein n=1 Tax=Mycena maculata TaxID=230809 RepID=A0AAD7HCA4_9AGAR|nr:hypothetical protein DFH07DRAFT_1013792 [Mycena maculata]